MFFLFVIWRIFVSVHLDVFATLICLFLHRNYITPTSVIMVTSLS